MKTKELKYIAVVVILMLAMTMVILPLTSYAADAYSIDYSSGTITLDQVDGETPNASFQVKADKTNVQKTVDMGNSKSSYSIQEIISNSTNGYWKQIENDNPDVFSQYADENTRYSGDYTIVANRSKGTEAVDSSPEYNVTVTAQGSSWSYTSKDNQPAQDVMYALVLDFNGGINNGLTQISEIKGGTVFEIKSSLFEEYREKVIPPTGKVFAGIEVNGVPKTVNTSHTVTGNVTVKFLWANEVKTVTTSSYYISEGANTNYVLGSASDVTIKASGDAEALTDLLMDGTSIPKDQYTITSGSTVAKLKSAYMETLSEGSHKLIFKYADGEASTTIRVAKANTSAPSSTSTATTNKTTTTNTTTTATTNNTNAVVSNSTSTTNNNPKTGDEGIAIWIALIVLSIIGIKKAIDYSKKI